ncbi:ERF family protein [Aetokthonos hydrillicola Thurmond2011]|uniref:ERF family protein n=1 Tax=Aetokthonos hydrillicola Thurmond2011 TaxID=2712845 RepID=A0AAP5IF36_9CYAN|nr:ERF family protein [Aetokthonos hydrillicola]MBW4591155.1 ERF family protein [Aetokthonos hydrillicola CCALA 1050]MDR9900548.1 ERF family protein [Aetokthonos hydrillicola Thurmond2011]
MQELIKALIKAKSEFSNIQKDRVNPHFKHKYATLDAVLDAVTPALGKHGLAVVQTTALESNKTVLQTHLYHESGECITSIYPLPEIGDSQKFGAALTYARRYALCAILCVTADEDDDASSTVTTPKKQSNLQYKVNSNGEHPHNSRIRAIRTMLRIEGKAVVDWLKTEKLVSSPAELDNTQLSELVQWMGVQWAAKQGMQHNHAANSFIKHIPAMTAQGYEELEAIKQWMNHVQQQQAEQKVSVSVG